MKKFATLFAIGDNVILSGAIVYLARKFGPLRLLCPERIFPSVSTFYLSRPEIVPVVPSDEEIIQAVHHPDPDTIAHNLLSGPGYLPWESFDRYVYRNLGIPLDVKWDDCPLRESARQVKQFEAPPGIPLVIDDPSRDFRITRLPPPPYARVTDSGGSILQYTNAIENASEVHVIDGCFLHLTDALEPQGQLWYHRYARSYAPGLKDFALRHGWNVYAFAEDWDMRLAEKSENVTLAENQALFTKTVGRVLTKTPEGWWILEGDPHGSRETRDRRRLDWDREMLEALGKYIRPASAVLDVGAHIGNHTIFYLDAVGPEGKVFAFEPYLQAYTCLRRNCPRAESFNIAIGERDGFCELELNPESRAMNRVTGTSGTFPIRRLDSLRDEFGYLPGGISLIKIDVEGYELRVLQGAVQLIKEFSPALCLEVHEPFLREAGTSPQEIYRFLRDLDYRIIDLPEGWSDVIALPK